jgi:hypothetical protein
VVALRTSVASRPMISFGVPAGATIPFQSRTSKAG